MRVYNYSTFRPYSGTTKGSKRKSNKCHTVNEKQVSKRIYYTQLNTLYRHYAKNVISSENHGRKRLNEQFIFRRVQRNVKFFFSCYEREKGQLCIVRTPMYHSQFIYLRNTQIFFFDHYHKQTSEASIYSYHLSQEDIISNTKVRGRELRD